MTFKSELEEAEQFFFAIHLNYVDGIQLLYLSWNLVRNNYSYYLVYLFDYF